MKEFYLQVITPSSTAYAGNVKSVTIPGTAGSFQVLFNHAPLISSFEIGKIKVIDENGVVHFFATGGGTVEVKDNNVLILAESFEKPAEINVDRATASLQRAKERLNLHSKDIDTGRAEASLARAMNRISINSKYKTT